MPDLSYWIELVLMQSFVLIIEMLIHYLVKMLPKNKLLGLVLVNYSFCFEIWIIRIINIKFPSEFQI